ncbi:hypothetical protein FNV43_RR09510 [Rhamnella rubrinervis]|uniref:Major facilitator superfamily (MFS) profile domain-containing protein n=1 Tax=Rhamnella rubrinervis TaxID=2594499 RepID=A0A8K0HA82_9ROSA|nr:hypothetical protein FNV43_RR09510 [Rhamnella rubrinervis]
MADSTSPLLKADCDQFSDSESEPKTPLIHNIPPPTSLDSVIEKITQNSGFAQFMQAILVSLSSLFDGQQSFISVFSDAQPTWHCTDTSDNSTWCSSTSNVCQMSSSAWAWDRSASASIISDFNLQCSPSIISGLPASSFFFGCLLGGFILATLADSSLGRKNLLFLSCFIMSVSALITSFSTNVWIYSALRFVSGFGRVSIGGCALVLSTEMMSRKWRDRVGIIGFLCFTLGFLSLPAIAYVNKDSSWRSLYLWTSIPGIVYCAMIFFFVRESPKWLLTQGRKGEALAILERFGEANNNINMSSSTLFLYSRFSLVEDEENSGAVVDVFASLRNLFNKRWALRRVMTLMVLGVGAGMIYYGMPLGVGSLGFNTYVSVTINALSEIPSYALTFIIIGSWNRRTLLLLFSLISGIGSIMCVVVSFKWKALQIGFEMLSFFCGNVAFAVLMIYTLELFPTSVRNSATSMVRQASVLGATISPMLISAGRNNGGVLSYGVFGVVIMASGLFVLYLPETRGETLCDTMEEQERKENAINQHGGV